MTADDGFHVDRRDIVGIYLLATVSVGIMVRKYVGTVEHFPVAGREMTLYLGICSLAATEFGIVTCMYTAQNGHDKGFAGVVIVLGGPLNMGVFLRTGGELLVIVFGLTAEHRPVRKNGFPKRVSE